VGTWLIGHNCGTPNYAAAACGNPLQNISATGTLATNASNCDDCSDLNIPIGFSFPFYENSFTTIAICSNGFASLNQDGASPFTNQPIPSVGAPDNLVAPFWDDFNPGVAGDVYYQTFAGPQRMVIQWNAVRQFGQASGASTFQAILYATGNIEYRYGTMTPAAPYSASVGIENSTGTVGTSIDPSTVQGGNSCASITFIPGVNPCIECPGDTDNDGDVDADDLTNVILQWGSTCPCNADVDNDNDVDADDLTIVILNWGSC
jgi:hypothetical protein